ncbi:MAG: integrase [Crocinitomicaceae bacterium]|nr:integrase [Crocinitomicaceae bacterium]
MPKLSEFIEHLKKERRLSEHTIRNYKSDLDQLSVYIMDEFELKCLCEVKSQFLRSWVVSLMKSEKSPRSIHRKVSSYRTFVKFARRKGWMVTNPIESVVLPKLEKRLPNVVPEHVMNSLFLGDMFPSDWLGRRDQVLISLLYETGLRRSELISLKTSSLDEGRNVLKVYGKGGKERMVPLLKTTINSLKKHIYERPFESESLLITDKGKVLSPSFVYRKVNFYLSEVSTLQKCSPHVLRHTFATHLLNNGAELAAVKDLLGHASFASTQVYTHHTTSKLKEFHRSSPLDRRKK